MKIRTDFVTNSSSSSFLVITITKKDGAEIVLECEDRRFDDIIGAYEYSTIQDLYDALLECFENDDEGIENFFDQVLEIGEITDIETLAIENSFSAWESEAEDPEAWNGEYDTVNYDEETGIVTGTDIAVYSFEDGCAICLDGDE